MDEAPIPLLIALSVLLALAVGCIIYLITRIQALKQRVSEADIRQMVDMGEETGEIEKEERELIENVFEFNNSTAAEVMIHRTDVVMLWAEDPDEEIMKTIRDSGLTRFPVYEEDTDDIIGIPSLCGNCCERPILSPRRCGPTFSSGICKAERPTLPWWWTSTAAPAVSSPWKTLLKSLWATYMTSSTLRTSRR